MSDKEPQRYYDWMLWKLRQDADWNSIKEKTREPFIRQL